MKLKLLQVKKITYIFIQWVRIYVVAKNLDLQMFMIDFIKNNNLISNNNNTFTNSYFKPFPVIGLMIISGVEAR